LATVAWRDRHARLDPGFGGSGPHDFAVRIGSIVVASRRVHRIPPPRSVTIGRNAPLAEAGWTQDTHDLRFCKSEIFLIAWLDTISENQTVGQITPLISGAQGA
jgi:hypothetical protein